MIFNKGLGIAAVTDGFEAGRLASMRALSQNPGPDVAILFASSFFDQQKVLAGVREALKNTPVFGSSSYFEMSNIGMKKHSVVILLISSDAIDFKIYAGKCRESLEDTAGLIASNYLADNPVSKDDIVSCLLAGTEHHLKGIKYLSGIKKRFPFPLPVSGGGSAGKYTHDMDADFFRGHQYFNNDVATDSLSLLFMKARDSKNIRFGYAYQSSWSPIARPVVCTRATGNVVHEVENIPVMEYLKNYLGENFAETLTSTRYKYSFIAKLKDKDIEKCLIRTPGAIDFENGSIAFFPNDDMQGMEIQLVQLSREELLESARSCAVSAREALSGYTPQAVFVFSCHLRNKVLHSRTGEEINIVREIFGDKVPIMGFYCASEYAPLYNRYEDITDSQKLLSGSRQLSTSISIMAIGSRKGGGKGAVNYHELLKKYESEDEKKSDPEKKRLEKIEELKTALDNAEEIISETEKAFKYINNEHYLLTIKLQEKNLALERANDRNEKLQRIIEQYTPHNVWKKAHISVDAGRYDIPDEELFCTLMFLDIKGFTSFAEKHPPHEVIAALNRIFSPVTSVIYENNGDIDKFIGDCVFAVFASVQDALKSAFGIQSRLKTMKDNPFPIRIGLNTGRVISGNVGGQTRRDNTLIGDAVNLAQRLESNCTPGAILMSKESFSQVDDGLLRDRTVAKKQITVKGKEKPLEVFEITP